MKRLSAALATLALILSACSIPMTTSTSGGSSSSSASSSQSSRGSLLLAVSGSASSSAKTILPTGTIFSSYTAVGSGPSGASTGTVSSDSGSFSFDSLATGSWTFTVKGLDGDKNVIAAGSATLSVTEGSQSSATVVLAPAGSATGTLSLSVSWPSTRIVSSVSGSLVPSSGGSSSDIGFTLGSDGASASYSGSWAPGSYILSVVAKNGSNVVASRSLETVIIYSGKSSSWTAAIDESRFVSSSKELSSFSFASPAVSGTISGTAVSVSVPYGSSVTGLVASFATSGASVLVNGTAQASGATANDFSRPVKYTVVAEDATTKDYTVTVTVLGASSLSVTSSLSISLSASGSDYASSSSTLAHGSDMTVTASPSAGADSYAWYLDGSQISGATSASVIIGSSLAVGPHSLAVVVKKGGVPFSGILYFTVK